MKIHTEFDPNAIHKIAINCAGLIGDVLIRTPFIEAVAKIFPEASITVIVDPGRESLLQNHPNVDNIIVYQRRRTGFWRYLKNLIQFIKQLRRQQFDILFDCYNGGSSRRIAKLSHAKMTVGFFKKKKHKRFYTHPVSEPEWRTQWSRQFGELLTPFGVAPDQVRVGTTFVPTDMAKQSAETFMAATRRGWVMMHLGAGGEEKIWPVKKFFAIAKWLIEEKHYHVGVFVSLGQEHLTDEFVELCQTQHLKNYTLIDEFAFDKIGALIQRAKFFIANDTGYLHIAFGVKTPAIGIFTHTRPEQVMPEDTLATAYFESSIDDFDRYGRPHGDKRLSVESVQSAIETLESKLPAYTVSSPQPQFYE